MPITSSEWSYYGGYLVFTSSASSTGGGGLTSTQWDYWGGYLVFASQSAAASSAGGLTSTQWNYYGGYLVFSTVAAAASSGVSAPVSGFWLISPTFQSASGRLTNPRV